MKIMRLFIPILIIFLIFGIACTSIDTGVLNQKNKESVSNSRIIFVSDRDGNNEIYIMNADGSGQINLTNNPASDVTPSFSP